jgi:hypothetical protein
MILVIPRNDGLKISVEGKLHHKDMTPEEMMQMGIRFQQAALEMIRLEQLEAAFDQPDAEHGSAPVDTNG